MLQLSDLRGHRLHRDRRLGLAPLHLPQVLLEVSQRELPLLRGPQEAPKPAPDSDQPLGPLHPRRGQHLDAHAGMHLFEAQLLPAVTSTGAVALKAYMATSLQAQA